MLETLNRQSGIAHDDRDPQEVISMPNLDEWIHAQPRSLPGASGATAPVGELQIWSTARFGISPIPVAVETPTAGDLDRARMRARHLRLLWLLALNACAQFWRIP
jgi:hypothetical protein